MKCRSALALLLLGVVPVLFLGCSSTPDPTADIDRADADYVVVERVSKVSEQPLPPWVLTPRKYTDAKSGAQYFVGVGIPRQGLQFAMNSAAEDAYMKIAKYMGQVVAAKWQKAGEAKNVHGQQSVDTVVEQFVQKTVAIAQMRRAKLEETHIDRVVGIYGRTGVEMFQVYQLYGVAESDLIQTGKDAAKEAAEALQNERDEIRKKQLEKLEKMLDSLSTDDFSI